MSTLGFYQQIASLWKVRSYTSLNYTYHNFLAYSRCSVNIWKLGLMANSWKKSTCQGVNEVFTHSLIHQIFIRYLLYIWHCNNEISLKIHVFFFRIASDTWHGGTEQVREGDLGRTSSWYHFPYSSAYRRKYRWEFPVFNICHENDSNKA